MHESGHGEDVEVDEELADETTAWEPQDVLADPDPVRGIATVYEAVPEFGPEVADGSRFSDVTEEGRPVFRFVESAPDEDDGEEIVDGSIETHRGPYEIGHYPGTDKSFAEGNGCETSKVCFFRGKEIQCVKAIEVLRKDFRDDMRIHLVDD